MNVGIIGQAAGLFAVTNIDDLLVLALFFGQGANHPGSARHIAAGQYLGFAVILTVAVTVAFGATFLPESAIPYLGLLPIALGGKAAWLAGKNHRNTIGDPQASRTDHTSTAAGEVTQTNDRGPKTLEVAAVTVANGGDNIGIYVPVFATTGPAGMPG